MIRASRDIALTSILSLSKDAKRPVRVVSGQLANVRFEANEANHLNFNRA